MTRGVGVGVQESSEQIQAEPVIGLDGTKGGDNEDIEGNVGKICWDPVVENFKFKNLSLIL